MLILKISLEDGLPNIYKGALLSFLLFINGINFIGVDQDGAILWKKKIGVWKCF